MDLHDFYCINCGKKAFSIMRKQGFQYKKFHRKKLYCPWCQITINTIECRNEEEAYEFKQDFENGVYVNECEENMAHVRTGGVW